MVVDDGARAVAADPLDAARSAHGDHFGAAQGGQLHNQAAGDPAGAVDQQRFASLDAQRLGQDFLGGQRDRWHLTSRSSDTTSRLKADSKTSIRAPSCQTASRAARAGAGLECESHCQTVAAPRSAGSGLRPALQSFGV